MKDPAGAPNGVRKGKPASEAPKGGNDCTVTINGESFAISLSDGAATVNGKKVNFSVQDGIKAPAAKPAVAAPVATAAASGDGEAVPSPLPGLVLRLIASDGAQVEADQDILILEAMKMEIPVKSPCAGTVSITVAAGDKVNSGDPLFTVA